MESQLGSRTQKSEWDIKRTIHQSAYEEVCSYVVENAIGKNNCFFLSFLIRMYTDKLERSLEQLQNKGISINLEANFHLEKKLLEKFPKKIKIVTIKKKKVIPYIGVF